MLFNAYKVLAYYFTFFLFGLFGLALNLFCLLLSWVPASAASERFFQRLIRRHFALFLWWLTFSRLGRFTYVGFEEARLPRGAVVVANHPGLLDAPYLLARLPEAICIFKPSIRRNPVLGAAARCAGYLASNGGIDLIREAGEKVRAGHTLVIFPEGSRTPPGGALRAFKPGFALIAQRAAAPIHLVRITSDSELLVKGRPWWKMPRLPAHVTIELGPSLTPRASKSATEVNAEVEAWFRAGTGAVAKPGHDQTPNAPGFLSAT